MRPGFDDKSLLVDWNKFYGEVCPVCRKPVMTKEWRREHSFASATFLRWHGFPADKHAKFVYLQHFDKKHKMYPVHGDCRLKLEALDN